MSKWKKHFEDFKSSETGIYYRVIYNRVFVSYLIRRANLAQCKYIRKRIIKEMVKVKDQSEYHQKPMDLETFESCLALADERIQTVKRINKEVTDTKNKRKEYVDGLIERAKRTEDERRNIAVTIKKKLNNTRCPYCSDTINDDSHADHIYPVSKGGSSTIKNMVMVCRACNLKKKNLTLTNFIRKFELNREEIEARLDRLKKDF